MVYGGLRFGPIAGAASFMPMELLEPVLYP